MRFSTEAMSASVMVAQAPGTMTISFWLLFSSTMISATPVGAVSLKNR